MTAQPIVTRLSLVAALAFVTLAGPLPAALAQGGPPPALVRVGEITQETLQARFSVVGRLQEVRSAVVAAEVEGKLIEVTVEEGDTVVGGETVLARVDPVWTRLMRDAAKARVRSAQATLDQARLDLKYLEQLQEANSAKQREVDDARALVASNEADLDAAKVELERAREMIERLTVRAPFDGVVVEKTAEVGQWVEPGGPICTMISRGRIDAVVGTPERLARRVSVGDKVEVLIEPLEETVMGEVVSIIPRSRNAARTFPTKIRLDDHDGRLKSGMSVTARIPTSSTDDFMTVPRNAVVRTDEGSVVWVPVPPRDSDDPPGASPPAGDGESGGKPGGEAGDGSGPPPMPTAGMVGVRVLFGAGNRVAIAAMPNARPLKAGDRVVVEGMETLFPGRPLTFGGEGPQGVQPPGTAETDENEANNDSKSDA